MRIRYTLLTDGSSDRVLLTIIDWLLAQLPFSVEFQSQWADPAAVNNRGNGLESRIRESHSKYPCDLLVVHRDSESIPHDTRTEEVERALNSAGLAHQVYAIAVPVRMTEAWFLFDESAIRKAAGNPNGRVSLSLPPLHQCESLRDPKQHLYDTLRLASGLSARRAKKFRPSAAVYRLAQEIEDFRPLRTLAAFAQFEQSLSRALDQLRGRESVSGGVERRR
ncbi:MAG: hypothetical protein MUF01_01090 [Bryobacterales bacterium]|jgi:hypothetical protein|nr:hypothetical protein [Bryobacterales bacterium]